MSVLSPWPLSTRGTWSIVAFGENYYVVPEEEVADPRSTVIEPSIPTRKQAERVAELFDARDHRREPASRAGGRR